MIGLLGCGALFIVLLVVGAVIGASSDDEASTEKAASPASSTSTTKKPATTTTEEPTTTTTAPTTTTTTAPPPPPVVLEGSGDSVEQLTMPDAVNIATITYDGGGNFAVWALDANLQQLDLLVNEIGGYAGTVLVPDGTTGFEITASGPWTFEVKSLRLARPFDGSAASGRGDDVLVYIGAAGVAAINHTGDGNFAVWSYPITSGRSDLLVNEIGPYSGSVRFPANSVVQITANGDWSIAVG